MSKNNTRSKDREKQKAVKKRLSHEDLSLLQLLYLVKKQGLEDLFDYNGGFYPHRAISLLSKFVDIEDIDTIIDDANSVNLDLVNLDFELNQLNKNKLKAILKKETSVSVPSSFLINAIFLFVPFETIKKELNYNESVFNELSFIQLLYLLKKEGLEYKLDIKDGISHDRAVNLLLEYIPDKNLNDMVDDANSVNLDLVNLDFELNQLEKNELKAILKKETSVSVPSSFLINAIFLFVPFETIKKELDYTGHIIVEKPFPTKSKKITKKSTSVKKHKKESGKYKGVGSKSVESGAGKYKGVGSKSVESGAGKSKKSTPDKQLQTIIFEVDKDNLKSKLLEYDIDYLLDILFNNKEYFEPIKDLTVVEFKAQKIQFKEKITKEKLVKMLLDNVSSQILEEYFNPIVYESFPYSDTFKEARSFQVETISQIYNAIEAGYKYIVLEAVSGYGKSLIAATLARIYSNDKTYILTTTNQLLTPYRNAFKDYNFFKVKARSNFVCKKRSDHKCTIHSCKVGLERCRHYDNLDCNYLKQFLRGQESDAMICTYDYFFTNTFYQEDELEHRKLLICDEGHNIDKKLSNGVSLKLFENRLKKIGIDIERERKFLDLTRNYYNFVKKVKVSYEYYLKNANVGRHNKRNFSRDIENINKFLDYFERNDNNLAFEYIEAENRANTWQFSPVKIQKFIPEAISNYSDVCIFMSSSFFDIENFVYDLGINEDEVFKIRVPNIFDLSNNPIFIYNDLEMDYENLKNGNAEASIPIIKDILKKHKNEKGVIHTFSNEWKDFLENNLHETRCLSSFGETREELLYEFERRGRGTVLISPSMDEGVDLKDKDCSFQIIFKLPYPPRTIFNEKRKAMDDGKDWYDYKMLTRLIQAYGRGIRSEKDSCKTYILDKRLWNVILKDYEKDTNLIPQYFIDAIVDYK